MANPRRNPRFRVWRRRVVVAGVSTIVALLLAEVLYRVFEPQPYRRSDYVTVTGLELPQAELANLFGRAAELNQFLARPRGTLPAELRVLVRYDRPHWDYFDANGCFPLEINSLGFRDHEFPVAKPPQELRILALGDSFTYGWGVRAEDSWPELLERGIAADRRDPVQVINAGFAAGAPTPDGYDRWLESDGLLLAPDAVIVGLCLNDMGEVPMLGYPIEPPLPVLGGHSRLLDAAWREVRQMRTRARRRDMKAIVDQEPKYWNATKRALERVRDLLAPLDKPMLVVVFPMLSQLERDYPYAGLHTLAVQFCEAANIDCLDLGPDFVGRDAEVLTVHPTDQHPNPVAHAIFARRIREHLARNGVLSR